MPAFGRSPFGGRVCRSVIKHAYLAGLSDEGASRCFQATVDELAKSEGLAKRPRLRIPCLRVNVSAMPGSPAPKGR
jgi:hypothetical protein